MMKRGFLILLTIVSSFCVNAQQSDRFSIAAAISTGIDMSTPTVTPFIAQVTGYYCLNKHFSTGLGTGLSFYEELLIPLLAEIKFDIKKTGKFIPFLECDAGYSFAPDKKAHGGFCMNPSVGVHYTLCHKKKLFTAIGYGLQKLERLKTYQDPYLKTAFIEKLSHHLIMFKAGVIF